MSTDTTLNAQREQVADLQACIRLTLELLQQKGIEQRVFVPDNVLLEQTHLQMQQHDTSLLQQQLQKIQNLISRRQVQDALAQLEALTLQTTLLRLRLQMVTALEDIVGESASAAKVSVPYLKVVA